MEVSLPTDDNMWLLIWIAAIAASVIGFGFLFHSTYIAFTWPKAVGRVVGNRSEHAHHDAGSSIVYFAEIEFRAKNGRDYTVRGDVGLRKPWQIGHPVKVHYKAKNPLHAMTMKPWQRLIFSGAFIGFAIVLWGLITGLIER